MTASLIVLVLGRRELAKRATRPLEELALELSARGHAVVGLINEPVAAELPGVTAIALGNDAPLVWSAWCFRRRVSRWLRTNAARTQAVIVDGLLNAADCVVEAVTAAPVMVQVERTGLDGDCHGQLRQWRGIARKRACQRATLFVARSQYAERELIAAGYPRDRIVCSMGDTTSLVDDYERWIERCRENERVGGNKL